MIAFNNIGAIRRISAATEFPFVAGFDTCIANVSTDGRILGGAFFTNYTGKGGSAQVHWAGFYQNWLTPTLLRTICDYAYNTLCVSKIVGIIPACSSKGLSLSRRLGFREECIIDGMFTYEGKSVPAIVLSLTRAECKYLRG